MENLKDKTNRAYICGEIDGEPKLSHEERGEKFYEMTVKVPRLSGQTDNLPVTISERLVNLETLRGGAQICAVGQFRSYNKIIDGNTRLCLTFFVRELLDEPTSKNPNQIILAGYICKPPVYRITPLNREIADLLIAVNRSYGKSDYIPAIAWGRNANFVDKLEVGDRIVVVGRIQSREYQKATDSGIENRIAYEVSISTLYAVDSEEEMNEVVEEILEHNNGGLN